MSKRKNKKHEWLTDAKPAKSIFIETVTPIKIPKRVFTIKLELTITEHGARTHQHLLEPQRIKINKSNKSQYKNLVKFLIPKNLQEQIFADSEIVVCLGVERTVSEVWLWN